MFTEAFFIPLTWAIVTVVLLSLISILVYRYALYFDLEWIIRDHLDESERYVKKFRSEEEKEKNEQGN